MPLTHCLTIADSRAPFDRDGEVFALAVRVLDLARLYRFYLIQCDFNHEDEDYLVERWARQLDRDQPFLVCRDAFAFLRNTSGIAFAPSNPSFAHETSPFAADAESLWSLIHSRLGDGFTALEARMRADLRVAENHTLHFVANAFCPIHSAYSACRGCLPHTFGDAGFVLFNRHGRFVNYTVLSGDQFADYALRFPRLQSRSEVIPSHAALS